MAIKQLPTFQAAQRRTSIVVKPTLHQALTNTPTNGAFASVDDMIGVPFLKQACSWSPMSAICVQNFDDSLSPAIHTRYRISLRSSSLREPRYPLLRVVFGFHSGHSALALCRIQKCLLFTVRKEVCIIVLSIRQPNGEHAW